MAQQQDAHGIPRLRKLGYLEAALGEVTKAATFDRIRQSLISFAAAQKSEDEMVGSPPIRDTFTFWSPTQEALSELMRLGFVEQAALPSERKYVDSYRDQTFRLTARGVHAAEKLASATAAHRAEFLDVLSVALAEAHPGFANILAAIEAYPLCIPEYTIEKISNLTQRGDGTVRLAEDAITRMTMHWPETAPKPSIQDLAAHVSNALDRRFSKSRVSRPSQKDVLDTVDDAILAFTAKSRNIQLDAISFNICMSWARQLALLEESRYVEGWPGRTVWATARIFDHGISRQGFRQAGDQIVAALYRAFRRVADAMPDGMGSGFLPIHRVRAGAAFESRVNLRLVNMVLGQLLSGDRNAPYTVQVSRGGGIKPPPSEPIFIDQGERFFELIITAKENDDAAERPT